jgi:hypothetical protein
MIYEEFLESLRSSGFKVVGRSFAFKKFGDWEIAFIRLSGKFQLPGKISFVICARPENARGLEGKIVSESSNVHNYPIKLIPSEVGETINYKSKILNYKFEELELDSDWTGINKILIQDLPEKLSRLGVSGLLKQLREIKNPGYIEKIWLGESVTDY